MNTSQIIAKARAHLGGAMESSARLALADAVKLEAVGELKCARKRALDSLAYSVGVLSPIYQTVSKHV